MAVADEVRARPGTDRVPPHNLEAEESVLGSMMLSPEAIASVIETLKAPDFYRPVHQKIFQAILSMYARGEPVDAITTVEELTRRGELEATGGALYIYNLVESVPTPGSAGYYAKIVSDHALLRRLIDAASQIMSRAYSIPEDPRRAADEAEGLVYAVPREDEEEELVPVRPVVDESMLQLEHIHQRESAFAGVPTGFIDVDNLLSGLQPGNLIVVAARPGVGKSSFVTNLARNVGVGEGTHDAKGSPVLMFSLEMSRWEIGMRLLCGEARVPWDKVRAGRLQTEEGTRVVEAAENLHDAPMFIVATGHPTTVGLRAGARP